MSENNRTAGTHNLILEDRKNLTVTGVLDVDSFDEQNVVAVTELGVMTVKGQGLHIGKLDVNTCQLEVAGEIDSINYSGQQELKTSFWAKLFR